MEKNHPLITTPLAHRGLHNEKYDENSLAAFRNAITHNYGIELDVHRLKDDTIVVIHDANMQRVTGYDINVEELTLDDLNKYCLLKTKERIPLLSEVLSLVNGQVPLLIELKVEGKFDPYFAKLVIHALADYKYSNLCLQSFNPYAVKELKRIQKRFFVGQLVTDVLPGQSRLVHFMFRSLYVLKLSRPDFLTQDVKYINKRKIARIRKNGLPVISWTITNEDLQITAKKYADNIIFENITP